MRMNTSRSKNAMLNILCGYLAQIGILVLSFVGRRIFLDFLSVEYLGINGLYSNILTVLSSAELGVDTALVYSLYKPVAEENVPLVNALLKYFKKIYILMAIGIFAIGSALIPFLKFIIKSELTSNELTLYYLLFLINTIASYFTAHKVAYLSACQEQRVQKLVAIFTNFLMQILHIIVLFVWRNYYFYIIATVVSTLISNFVLNAVCNRIHPNLKEKTAEIIFDKKPIRRKIGSTFIYKLGGVAINNTDNILISMLVSTAAVGFYSNYCTLLSAIQGFIAIISTTLISGIGNLAAHGDKKRQYEIFKVTLLLYHYIAALGFVGLGLLCNDFITIWLGAEYVLDKMTVFIIVFNFYLTNAITPIWMYREANGLFEQVSFLMLIRASVNFVLSIILGIEFGVWGILVSTAISLIITNFWYEPSILFKTIFESSVFQYWKKQIKYFIVTCLSMLISVVIMSSIPSGGYFVFKGIIVIVIVSVSFLLVSLKSDEVNIIFSILKIK